jgi:hypothetical protein
MRIKNESINTSSLCLEKEHAQSHQQVDKPKDDPTPGRQKKVRFRFVLVEGFVEEWQEPSRFLVLCANGRNPQQERGFEKNLERPEDKGYTTNQEEMAQINGMPDPPIRAFRH